MRVGFLRWGGRGGRGQAEAEFVEDVRGEEDRVALRRGGGVAKHGLACPFHAFSQLPRAFPFPFPSFPFRLRTALQHELKELRGALRVLVDLYARAGVEDGEAGVDVPLVGVDAEGEVYFCCFDAADVEAVFPGVGEG